LAQLLEWTRWNQRSNLLDHKGVIRYKGVRGESADAAIDKLLAEMTM
jgi:hypothetical protein